MSKAAIINLTIEQGEDFLFAFSYTDAVSRPIDMTGATASMMIRADLDTLPVATLTTANGKITWDSVTGIFSLTLSAEETLRITLKDRGVYDLFIHPVGGAIEKLIAGKVTFIRAVTR